MRCGVCSIRRLPLTSASVRALDQRQYDAMEIACVLVYAAGRPDWLARIDAADTVTDLQRIFNHLPESTVGSTVGSTSQELQTRNRRSS